MNTTAMLTRRWQTVMSDNYGTPPVAIVRGQGALVWDADGKQYLDMVAGIAVNAIGHAHPAIQAAVAKQLGDYGHVSNLAMHPVGIELAERLIELAGRPGRVFFCNSGTEANEAAFKVARLTGRTTVYAAQGGFHGRTMGALSLTGQPPNVPLRTARPRRRVLRVRQCPGPRKRRGPHCGTDPGRSRGRRGARGLSR